MWPLALAGRFPYERLWFMLTGLTGPGDGEFIRLLLFSGKVGDFLRLDISTSSSANMTFFEPA
jgi:hypothetical protein